MEDNPCYGDTHVVNKWVNKLEEWPVFSKHDIMTAC